MESTEKRRLQVNIELHDEEIDRFLQAKAKLRARTNAAAGYALLLNGLDLALPQPQEREEEPATAFG